VLEQVTDEQRRGLDEAKPCRLPGH
jgi:hypothetical protein